MNGGTCARHNFRSVYVPKDGLELDVTGVSQ